MLITGGGDNNNKSKQEEGSFTLSSSRGGCRWLGCKGKRNREAPTRATEHAGGRPSRKQKSEHHDPRTKKIQYLNEISKVTIASH